MPKHSVTKVIHFCYGHRLMNYDGECRNLHGHNGVLEVDIEADSLDRLGMVIDFTEVRDRVKGWIDANIDHKMLLNRKDPMVPVLRQMEEPFYLLDENPTAENIARLIFEATVEQGLDISQVRLWETESSYASYRAE